MSTLRVTNVQDTAGANSSTSAEIFSGRAKAWVNFNGTGTVAIRASFNVSSITDNGTGDYTVNFTAAMADANYTPFLTSVGASLTEMSRLPGIRGVTGTGANGKTSAGVRVISGQGWAAGLLDNAEMNAAIFR